MPVEFTGTRMVPLADLTRFPGNAHRGDVPAIRASLARTGQYRSLVVRDTGDALVILAGNHTADALEAEGHETARCEVILCTDAEATRINLADNRLTALGTDDPRALLAVLTSLEGDLAGSGWDQGEADRLRAMFATVDEPPPPPALNPREDTPPAAGHGQGTAGEPRPVSAAVGTAEVILVATTDERDRCVALLNRIRGRDGDLPAGRIVVEALRAYAPAAGPG